MKSLFDLGPVAAFFIAFKLSDLSTATWVLMGAQLVAAMAHQMLVGRLGMQMKAQSGVVFRFGGLTVYLQDPIFIMWKPTLINGAFALVLIRGNLFGRKSMLSRLWAVNCPCPNPCGGISAGIGLGPLR